MMDTRWLSNSKPSQNRGPENPSEPNLHRLSGFQAKLRIPQQQSEIDDHDYIVIPSAQPPSCSLAKETKSSQNTTQSGNNKDSRNDDMSVGPDIDALNDIVSKLFYQLEDSCYMNVDQLSSDHLTICQSHEHQEQLRPNHHHKPLQREVSSMEVAAIYQKSDSASLASKQQLAKDEAHNLLHKNHLELYEVMTRDSFESSDAQRVLIEAAGHLYGHPQNDSESGDSRAQFLASYLELLEIYEKHFENFLQSCRAECNEIFRTARLPDQDIETGEDGVNLSPQDLEANNVDLDDHETLQKLLRMKFVNAIEAIQVQGLPEKRRGNLPAEATNVFREWFEKHNDNPYPTEAEKNDLSRMTGISVEQVSNWFINRRKRGWSRKGRPLNAQDEISAMEE